jgi:hypothetical protein
LEGTTPTTFYVKKLQAYIGMMEQGEQWKINFYKELRKSLTPLIRDKYENVQHGYAKARIKHLLERAGYRVNVEMSMPCNDLIEPTYIHPFSLDIYAELWLPVEVSVEPGYIDMVYDRIAVEVGGLSTYHSKDRFAKRALRKKEMICSQYGIPPNRYFDLEKDWVFPRIMKNVRFLASDDEIYDRLMIKKPAS